MIGRFGKNSALWHECRLAHLTKIMTAIPNDDPMMVSWEHFKASIDYENTRKWALHEDHVDGSLWNAFMMGWLAKAADI